MCVIWVCGVVWCGVVWPSEVHCCDRLEEYLGTSPIVPGEVSRDDAGGAARGARRARRDGVAGATTVVRRDARAISEGPSTRGGRAAEIGIGIDI